MIFCVNTLSLNKAVVAGRKIYRPSVKSMKQSRLVRVKAEFC